MQNIQQEVYSFFVDYVGDNISILANPNEQIFGEKILSLAKHGVASTRYKDVYDIYFFINESLLDRSKVIDFFSSSLPTRFVRNFEQLKGKIKTTLNNDLFASLASKPENKWCDESYKKVSDTIISYLNSIKL